MREGVHPEEDQEAPGEGAQEEPHQAELPDRPSHLLQVPYLGSSVADRYHFETDPGTEKICYGSGSRPNFDTLIQAKTVPVRIRI